MIVIGLMSGTSCDAIEAAAAEFELQGERLTMTPLGAFSHPWTRGIKTGAVALTLVSVARSKITIDPFSRV
jgi:anhydro-N-acetylmuramic acid kinase